jgi:hypothetical protein
MLFETLVLSVPALVFSVVGTPICGAKFATALPSGIHAVCAVPHYVLLGVAFLAEQITLGNFRDQTFVTERESNVGRSVGRVAVMELEAISRSA